MHAEVIMVRDVATCRSDQTVEEALEILAQRSMRMLPVLDGENRVIGAVNTIKLLARIVPEYIVSGDLRSIPYAPDLGVLHKHYQEMLDRRVVDVMETNPTIVKTGESLLSVATALITQDFFDYAIVVDEQGVLAGVIAPSDILACLGSRGPNETIDA